MELVDHDKHDHVAAVFDTRGEAEAAVDELRAIGLGSEHLGVAVRGPAHAAFEYDEQRDLASNATVGAATGASLGALAGMALAALVVPGFGVIGLGGMLAVGVAGGWGGGMVGGYLGIATADREFEEHRELGDTPLGPDQVLVVVCAHGRRDEIVQVMGRHGGTQVDTERSG